MEQIANDENIEIIREPDFVFTLYPNIAKAEEAMQSKLYESYMKNYKKRNNDYDDDDENTDHVSKHAENYRNYIDAIKKNNNVSVEHYWKSNGRLLMKTVIGDFKTYITACRMFRQFRTALFEDNYNDIDIECCYPNIYKFLCMREGIETPELDKYLTEKHLDKVEVLKLICGNRYVSSEYLPLSKEIRRCSKQLNMTDNSKLSLQLQHYECVIVQHAIICLQNNGFEIGAYIYDSLLIRKSDKLPEFITKLNEYVIEKTNININFRIKQFEKCRMNSSYDFSISPREIHLYKSMNYIELFIMNSYTKLEQLVERCDNIAFFINDKYDCKILTAMLRLTEYINTNTIRMLPNNVETFTDNVKTTSDNVQTSSDNVQTLSTNVLTPFETTTDDVNISSEEVNTTSEAVETLSKQNSNNATYNIVINNSSSQIVINLK